MKYQPDELELRSADQPQRRGAKSPREKVVKQTGKLSRQQFVGAQAKLSC